MSTRETMRRMIGGLSLIAIAAAVGALVLIDRSSSSPVGASQISEDRRLLAQARASTVGAVVSQRPCVQVSAARLKQIQNEAGARLAPGAPQPGWVRDLPPTHQVTVCDFRVKKYAGEDKWESVPVRVLFDLEVDRPLDGPSDLWTGPAAESDL